MESIDVFIKRVLYDPVKARILYDFGVSVIIITLYQILFSTFGLPTTQTIALAAFPILFVLYNLAFGIYGRYKTTTVTAKAQLLSFSALTTLFTLLLFMPPSLVLVLTALFVTVLTTAPRAFFNFGIKAPKGSFTETLANNNLPILVVGGGGYIGSQLIAKLLQHGFKVRVLDKFLYGKEVLAQFGRNPDVQIIEGDVTELYALTLAVSGVRGVVHLAGLVGDPASALDAELTRHINIVATRMLKESVKAFSVPRFVFASSCSVYGESEQIVDENSSLHPVSLYAQTKIDAEKEIMQDTFDYFHPTILRFATVFGHSRKPRFDLVANLFTAQAYVDGVITVNGGNQWRPFIHVDDVSEAIVRTLEAPIEQVSRQVFNVGDDKLNMTITGVAEAVAGVVKKNKNGKVVKIKTRYSGGDKRNYHVSFEKIRRVLGFEARVSMEDGAREMLHQFKTHGYKKPYTDRYYKNVEMTKDLVKEFHSEKYKQTHFSTFSVPKRTKVKRSKMKK